MAKELEQSQLPHFVQETIRPLPYYSPLCKYGFDLTILFKFLKVWTLDYSCRQVIVDNWKTGVIGCPMHILSYNIKKWNKETFENINLKTIIAIDEDNNIQGLINDACYNEDFGLKEKMTNFFR